MIALILDTAALLLGVLALILSGETADVCDDPFRFEAGERSYDLPRKAAA